eukprot:TRINITY_DN53856_c0_g1_i1.p1 TRINITY_DN53856_c0_g1~~TRINITY_DN53856_c0_g1_i1.p1  ORF type:complete len:115 (-),score=3.99 TRINITY_DN53856_c0_g1_i1:145-489(-)
MTRIPALPLQHVSSRPFYDEDVLDWGRFTYEGQSLSSTSSNFREQIIGGRSATTYNIQSFRVRSLGEIFRRVQNDIISYTQQHLDGTNTLLGRHVNLVCSECGPILASSLALRF